MNGNSARTHPTLGWAQNPLAKSSHLGKPTITGDEKGTPNPQWVALQVTWPKHSCIKGGGAQLETTMQSTHRVRMLRGVSGQREFGHSGQGKLHLVDDIWAIPSGTELGKYRKEDIPDRGLNWYTVPKAEVCFWEAGIAGAGSELEGWRRWSPRYVGAGRSAVGSQTEQVTQRHVRSLNLRPECDGKPGGLWEERSDLR